MRSVLVLLVLFFSNLGLCAEPNCSESFTRFIENPEYDGTPTTAAKIADIYTNYYDYDKLAAKKGLKSERYYFDLLINELQKYCNESLTKYEIVLSESQSPIIRILPDKNGSRLNVLADSLERRFKLSFEFDPAKLKSIRAYGFASSERIGIDLNSLLAGKPSPTIVHEIRHAYLNYRQQFASSFFGLHFFAGDKGISPHFDFGAYQKGFRIDEVVAHLQGTRYAYARYFRDLEREAILDNRISSLDAALTKLLAGDQSLDIGDLELWTWQDKDGLSQEVLAAEKRDSQSLLNVIQSRKNQFERTAYESQLRRIAGMSNVINTEMASVASKLSVAADNLATIRKVENSYEIIASGGDTVKLNYRKGRAWSIAFDGAKSKSESGYYLEPIPAGGSFTNFLNSFSGTGFFKTLKNANKITADERANIHDYLKKLSAWATGRSRAFDEIQKQALIAESAAKNKDLDEAFAQLQVLREKIIAEFYLEID